MRLWVLGSGSSGNAVLIETARSRILGIITVCIGTGPLGILAAGALAGEFGPRGAVLMMAVTGLLLTIALATALQRGRR